MGKHDLAESARSKAVEERGASYPPGAIQAALEAAHAAGHIYYADEAIPLSKEEAEALRWGPDQALARGLLEAFDSADAKLSAFLGDSG